MLALPAAASARGDAAASGAASEALLGASSTASASCQGSRHRGGAEQATRCVTHAAAVARTQALQPLVQRHRHSRRRPGGNAAAVKARRPEADIDLGAKRARSCVNPCA